MPFIKTGSTDKLVFTNAPFTINGWTSEIDLFNFISWIKSWEIFSFLGSSDKFWSIDTICRWDEKPITFWVTASLNPFNIESEITITAILNAIAAILILITGKEKLLPVLFFSNLKEINLWAFKIV